MEDDVPFQRGDFQVLCFFLGGGVRACVSKKRATKKNPKQKMSAFWESSERNKTQQCPFASQLFRGSCVNEMATKIHA